jgi:hypothetical protein
MFLRLVASGDLVRIDDVETLVNPFETHAIARSQAGEEEQELSSYAKAELEFLSGEKLPRCWLSNEHTAFEWALIARSLQGSSGF